MYILMLLIVFLWLIYFVIYHTVKKAILDSHRIMEE